MKKKLLIAIPHDRDIQPEFISSVFKVAVAMSNIGMDCDLKLMEGALISEQRNSLAKLSVNQNYDYILFADTDSVFDTTAISGMLDADKEIIGSLYYMRCSPYLPIVYEASKEKGDGYFRRLEFSEIPDNPFICGTIGAGLLLIKTSVIKKMLDEEFVIKYGFPFNLWQREDGKQLGEDMSFSIRARLQGMDTWCYPKSNMGHVGSFIVTEEFARFMNGIHYANDIEGWMNLNELNWLYQTAKGMDSIVELGSWKGKSTHALLCGCKGTVHAVDTFIGDFEIEDPSGITKKEGEGSTYDTFLKNVGNFNNLIIHREEALIALDLFTKINKKTGKKYDMVFLDDCHKYEHLKKEIEGWLSLTNKILCGHDYTWVEVERAVNEVLGVGKVEIIDTIWCYRIKNV